MAEAIVVADGDWLGFAPMTTCQALLPATAPTAEAAVAVMATIQTEIARRRGSRFRRRS